MVRSSGEGASLESTYTYCGLHGALVPTLARWAYSLWTVLSVPARFARLWWRGRRHAGYRRLWRERLALGGPRAEAGSIWVHAHTPVELRTAATLIEKLRDLDPRWRSRASTATSPRRWPARWRWR